MTIEKYGCLDDCEIIAIPVSAGGNALLFMQTIKNSKADNLT